jgi:predicted homoserine dehydrogenase-like protein
LLGPILKAKADQAGVVLTQTDGGEPGAAMTLLRYFTGVGASACSLASMFDYYRTLETQKAFAEKNDLDARKITSFARSSEAIEETTVLTNAIGFHPGRGRYGPACEHVRGGANLLPFDQMTRTGL